MVRLEEGKMVDVALRVEGGGKKKRNKNLLELVGD